MGVTFEWNDIKYIIVDSNYKSNMVKRLLYDVLGCDNHDILIFTEKQVKTDFIGTVHNIKLSSITLEDNE